MSGASLGLFILSLLTATTVLSACIALPKASTAGSIAASFVGLKRISTPGAAAMGIPAGWTPTAGWPGGMGMYVHPACSSAEYKDSQKAMPSSAAWETAARYFWPANGRVASATNCWREELSVLGVLSFSRANCACAARALASAARASAAAIPALASAVFLCERCCTLASFRCVYL